MTTTNASEVVRFQILSDLHLEVERGNQPLYEFSFPAKAPYLALLGDIGWTRDERLFQFLESQCSRFERVFFVSGNHEPYIGTLEESISLLEDFERNNNAIEGRGEFIFLNRRRYDISPTLTILGCTLWSALNNDDLDILRWSLTDFKSIDMFTPYLYTTRHQVELAWLTQTLQEIRSEEPNRRVVVFTHHAPTIEGTGDLKFLGGPTNSAFATELWTHEVWGPPVVLWAFGHTHWSCDFERNGVRVYSNQRGYGSGNRPGAPIFNAEKTTEVQLK